MQNCVCKCSPNDTSSNLGLYSIKREHHVLFIWVSKLEILWLDVFFVWWKAKVLQALNFEIRKWERVVIAVFVLIWSWLSLMCRIKSNSQSTGSYLVLCYSEHSKHFHTACLIHSFTQVLCSKLFLCKYFLSNTHTPMHRRGHQSFTVFTHRDRQPFVVTHTTYKKKKACSNGNKVLLFHNILKTDTFSETFNTL